LIREIALPKNARVIDVGGGASTLVDDLLDLGYANVSVLDISKAALEIAKTRLGACAARASWIVARVLDYPFQPNSYDLCHDRDVFRFLTAVQDQETHLRQVLAAVKPPGFRLIGTVGPEGPERCSGLKVARYSVEDRVERFRPAFSFLRSSNESHHAPS